MGEVPSPALDRWKMPDRSFWTRLAQWVLCIAILVCLVFIYFLGMQLRYESEASRYFKEQKYETAAEKYLRAHDEARFWGRDRYLYLIACCWLDAKDKDRAMQFLIRLHHEHPDSEWLPPSLALAEAILEPPPVVPIKATTKLSEARAELRASYGKMVKALKSNKGGVSIELEGEYTKYKKYWESYKRELAKAHKAVQEGVDPERVDIER
jgi:tetratricopeptide (TPR) repeat protein